MAAIVEIVPAISVEASGPSYSVPRLTQAVRDAGLDTALAALEWSPIAHVPEGVVLFPLGSGPRRLGRSPALKEWLAAGVRQGSIRLLHSHGLWMMPNMYSGWIARESRVPYVVSPRGTLRPQAFSGGSWLKRLVWPLWQKPALACTSCWHATSWLEYQDIRQMGFGQPVAVVPNGIDIPNVGPKARRDPRTLLYLGRLHPTKGLDSLLRAWAAVEPRYREWRLRIVGPDQGGYLRELHALSRKLRLRRAVLDGPLYGDAKWKAYAEAELFVLPTRFENFGMAVAEALAAGTPVIVSRNAPWSGIAARGCGWCIEPSDDALVACLEEALSYAPDRLEGMGKAGRAWMEQEFSWPTIGRRMASVYRWLLGAGPRPADVVTG